MPSLPLPAKAPLRTPLPEDAAATRGRCIDTDLIQRVQAGDETAVDQLLELHWLPVVDYIERVTNSRDLAEDIAQEVFLALWQRTLVWRGTGSLRAFLLGTARNLARNQGRRWREVRVSSFESPIIPAESHCTATPAERFREEEVEAMYRAAVAALPARRQEVFLLARVHGLSHHEIAETMEISVQTVANQMSSALADLRRALAPLLDH